ncbi:hypothetical protein J1N35_005256 [Gossypium stocksii]|uniref:Uncharacterized protein n=1 Tax=Gossypium stocksii TaxID=47602 RepID=A0A9D3WDG6_9ROSI|nr:hypothetical protein J1N35_005256 [Gossypium stocksii]
MYPFSYHGARTSAVIQPLVVEFASGSIEEEEEWEEEEEEEEKRDASTNMTKFSVPDCDEEEDATEQEDDIQENGEVDAAKPEVDLPSHEPSSHIYLTDEDVMDALEFVEYLCNALHSTWSIKFEYWV